MTTMPTALTPRELEVARLIAEGYTDKQVGAMLCPPCSQQRACRLVHRLAKRLELDLRRDIRRQIAIWYQTAQRAA